jgi:membrane-bound metal-dependent hydrolase YbcI (DUF457 family)
LPSPIAHSVTGYIAYRAFERRFSDSADNGAGHHCTTLLAATGLSLLPDVDSLLGIARDDMWRYHNNGTHSLLAGLGIALLVGSWAALRRCSCPLTWFLLSLVCYESHVVLDFFSGRRGVMLFWPLSSRRFKHPVKLFYGTRWSAGIASKHHLLTAATEIALAVVALLLLHLAGRSPMSDVAGGSP